MTNGANRGYMIHMTSTQNFPEALNSVEDLEALAGRKVTLEYDYQAPTRRPGRTEQRTTKMVGTIVEDDRHPGTGTYLIERRTNANVIVLSMGYRVVKVWS